MTVYVVAQLIIHEPDRYQRYVRRFHNTLAPFAGTLLAADEHPEVIEGEWDRDKIVLIAFADHDECRRWMTSPQYQAIAADRIAATTSTVLVVDGISPQSATESTPTREASRPRHPW